MNKGGESKLKQGDAVDVIIEKDSEGKQKNS
jgi:hypothetical protein